MKAGTAENIAQYLVNINIKHNYTFYPKTQARKATEQRKSEFSWRAETEAAQRSSSGYCFK